MKKMERKKIIFIISLIIALLISTGYLINKNKKDHYIEIQEKRIDLYFKYNLNHYSSMKV